MVACLVCLLINGADPTAKANLSVDLLLGNDEQHGCTHTPLDPLELGDKVPPEAWNSWSADTKLGWECFIALLGFAQRDMTRITTRTPRSSHGADDSYFDDVEFPPFAENRFLLDDVDGSDSHNYYDVDHDRYCDHEGEVSRGTTRHLSIRWSAIQAELVSYRRLQDGDAWISENFNLTAVRDGANAGAGFSRLPLLERRMMKGVCECGRLFTKDDITIIATTDEACAFYFSNMEDWHRSTYL